ncbi:MAG: SpoIIE family protein phosphatase [Akkermansiaceae bacterium]|nr:SpoIIE family protein phosphatase [Akkermansiaceae bacterium]
MQKTGEIHIDGDDVRLESLELALRASHEGIWDWWVDQPRVNYSRRILEFLECREDSAPNLFIEPYSFIHPEDLDMFSSAMQEAMEDGGPETLSVDARVQTGSGDWRWLRIRGIVVRDRSGKAKRIAGSMIDISQRKTAENQLEEERYQLRQLTDHIPVQVYFKDLESRFVMANRRLAEWVGLKSGDDLIGKHDRDFFIEQHWRPAAEDERRIIETGEPITGQLEHETRRDGIGTWVLTSKFPWRDRQGKIKGTFGVSSDVTKLIEAQRETTELAKELAIKNQAYEEELQLAREIQQALNFGKLDTLKHGGTELRFGSRYVPISGLAGDFYELIEISPTQVGILICDVMGHGVRSALIVAMLRGLIEKQGDQTGEPGIFMKGLNEGLSAILERAGVTMFATAFYGVIDLESGEMRCCSAGHPGPVVVDDSGCRQIFDKPDQKGPGLGLIRKTNYPKLKFSTDKIERILLFTDGVVEAENQAGEPFFEKGLVDIIAENAELGIEEMLDSILTSVLDFSHHHHFDDDVCLMGVEFKRT